MNGKDLKLLRVTADVKGNALAAAMGVHPAQVSRIENSRVVTKEMADRYVAALATLTTTTTSDRP
jgi:plasmid maintenance system antidote protein VapI